MLVKYIKLRGFIIAAVLFTFVGGAVFAAVVVATKKVSAAVTAQVTVPDSVEVYLDEDLAQIGTLIDFGVVNSDVFGTVDGDPPTVPIWIKNVSSSTVQLSLSDDFPHGNVKFQSGIANPLLQPHEALAGVFLLEFTRGVGGAFNFAVAIEAEGPPGNP